MRFLASTAGSVSLIPGQGTKTRELRTCLMVAPKRRVLPDSFLFWASSSFPVTMTTFPSVPPVFALFEYFQWSFRDHLKTHFCSDCSTYCLAVDIIRSRAINLEAQDLLLCVCVCVCVAWVSMLVCSVALVVSDSLWPHELQPARLLCPWDSPGKNTGVGCHFLLYKHAYMYLKIMLCLHVFWMNILEKWQFPEAVSVMCLFINFCLQFLCLSPGS